MQLGKAQKLRLACELGSDRVVAAHADRGILDLTVVRALGAGALVPSLTAGNLVHRDVVRTAVHEALAGVAGRSREVILVVPDGACRIGLLDFDSLPSRREEAEAIVRFRLKKALPFDVDRARVSFHPQVPENGRVSVVAAVALQAVLDEYESVVREAGYSPGVVMPSILAALGQVDASVPTLIIKADLATTSVAIADRDRLVLLRTLENPAGARLEPAQLAEDVYPSLVFYQDTFGRSVQTVLVGGTISCEQWNASLGELTGLRAQDLVNVSALGASATGPRAALGGVAGALLSGAHRPDSERPRDQP